MCYLQECLTIGMLQTLECHQRELNSKFLHDLHHGKATNEITYIQKMSLLPLNGRLWGDFIAIYWILKYLQLPIHIWNKNNCQITKKVRNENANHILNMLYANNHFEPTITCDTMINFSNIHTYDAYDTKLKNHNIKNEIPINEV